MAGFDPFAMARGLIPALSIGQLVSLGHVILKEMEKRGYSHAPTKRVDRVASRPTAARAKPEAQLPLAAPPVSGPTVPDRAGPSSRDASSGGAAGEGED